MPPMAEPSSVVVALRKRCFDGSSGGTSKISCSGKHQKAVARLENVLGPDVRMGIAVAPRRLAGDEIVHRMVGEERHAHIEHADVDVFALLGPLVPGKRGEHCNGPYMPAMMSTIGTPTFCGAPPGRRLRRSHSSARSWPGS